MDRSVKRVRCGVIGGGGWARWGGPDRCGISPSQHTRHERTCKVHRSLVPCVNPTPGYPLLSASQPPRNCGLPSCADVCGEDRGGSVRSMRRSINRPGRGRVGATQPLRHAPSCQRTCDVRTHVRVHIWIDAVAAAHTDRCQDGGTRRLAMSSAGPSTRNRLVWVDWASRFKGGAPVERDSSASSSFTPGGPLKEEFGAARSAPAAPGQIRSKPQTPSNNRMGRPRKRPASRGVHGLLTQKIATRGERPNQTHPPEGVSGHPRLLHQKPRTGRTVQRIQFFFFSTPRAYDVWNGPSGSPTTGQAVMNSLCACA